MESGNSSSSNSGSVRGNTPARGINYLSDRAIKAFIYNWQHGKPEKRKLSDGGSMFLAILPSGNAAWRLKYTWEGKERVYAIGSYPGVSLEQARRKRDEAKAMLREGKDPVVTRRAEVAKSHLEIKNTFSTWAMAWLEVKKADPENNKNGWSDIHYQTSLRALERDIFPKLGKLPMEAITPVMIAGAIEAVDKGRGARETASKILQHVRSIFRYAQAKGIIGKENPAEPVREVLSAKPATKPMAAQLEFKELGDILRRAEQVHLMPSVRMAHRLCAFTAARMGNIVEADWSEFNLESDPPVWVIPRPQMKAKKKPFNHKVILCPEIAKELVAWRAITGGKKFLFSAVKRGRHITVDGVDKLYRETLELRDKHTPHGWRSAFSTLARENGFERDVVELALDHIHDTEVVRAYDRGERLVRRIELMKWWGSELAKTQHAAGFKVLENKVA